MAKKPKLSKKMALAALKQSIEPISMPMLASKLSDVPERTLRRWLSVWVEEGIVKKFGNGRSTRYCYTKETNPSPGLQLHFLQGLDEDLKAMLINQLRDLWSYNSAAIEGNTLTLGDTHFLLEQGLTISGKPLKDHQEIIGHAKAIDLLYQCLDKPLTETIIFDLHQAVQTESISDIYKPIGHWKVETNGTYVITDDNAQIYIEYALPVHVPKLMLELINTVNDIDINNITLENAHQFYAKIHIGIAHIHPFWDGNGRIARLLANIPLLKAGLPPIVITETKRRAYIQTLANYQIKLGQLKPTNGVWPDASQLQEFEAFCKHAYSNTKTLVEKAFLLQKER